MPSIGTPSSEIAKLLDDYSSEALIQMAGFHSILPKQQKSKTILIQLISGLITDPQQVQKSLNSLPIAERAALDAILRRDGQTSVRNLRAELASLKLIDPKAEVEFGQYAYHHRPDPRAENSRRLEDILAKLLIRGLAFSADGTSGPYNQNKRTFYDAIQRVIIPAPIRRHLPQPAPLPQPDYHLPELKMVQEGSARAFQRELYLYWSYLRDHPTYLTAKDELAKQALKDVNSLLLSRAEIQTGKTENDYPRLRFLRSILASLKLVVEKPNQSVESGPGEFFSLGPADRVWRTFQDWSGSVQFNELLLLPVEVRPRSSPSNPLIPANPAVVRARQFIIDQIRKIKPSNWTSLQALVDRIYEHDYEFLLKRPVVPGYYYGPINPYEYLSNELSLGFRGIFREEEGWQKVEANFIRGIVAGPLFWMGLLDLGWPAKEEGAPAAFRLTALGQWVLGLGPQPEIPMEGGRVIVQPTMQVMALDPIQDAVLATLDRFAERLNADRAVEYRLTRASVYAAQQTGWDAAQIKATLEQYAGSSLPDNVARTLDEWQAQFERIVIHPQVTLMHGDPQAIDQIEGHADTKGMLRTRLMSGVAVLRNGKDIPKVTEALRSWNILPVINNHTAAPPNSVITSETGEVRFTTRLPSLYLHGHLAAFANPVDSGYQISRESVQRAVRSGLTAPAIIQQLAAANAGPLPEKLVLSIRAWARHYGSASLAPVLLLQVRDETALKELLADPAVGPLIRRFTPHPHALAQVKPDHLEKLRALLAERGIDLDEHLK